MDQIADLCHVDSGGYCAWDIALAELEQHFDIDDLEGDWEGIIEAIQTNQEPVIATIANPRLPLTGDHAIIILGLEATAEGEQITYMDPLTGNKEQLPLRHFLLYWDTPGERAFVLRP